MIMKKFIAIIMLAAMSLAGARAEERTLEYKFGDIKGIATVQSQVIPYEIHVTQGKSKDVKVVYDTELEKNLEDFEKYIKVDYSSANSTLILGMNPFPRRIEKFKMRFQTSPIKVYVEMDEIDGIDLSGASVIYFEGSFTTDSFEADLSGASKFGNTLNISGKELDVDGSGAAVASIAGDFRKVELDLSGAVKMYLGGSHGSCEMDCSGAANIEMEGKADTFVIDGSGACKVNGKEYFTEKAYIELSGACSVMIQVSEELKHDVATACKLTYFGSPQTKNLSESRNVIQGSR